MKEHYYFDNAATSWPKPEAVYQYMDQFFRSHGVNPGRSGHALAVEAETMIVQTRRLLGQFFGFSGDPQRVVFTQNATDSLNICLLGLIDTGDHAVITRLEHNSVLRPLNHMERDAGVSVTRLRGDGYGYIDPEDVRKAITDQTAVVVVNHASNVLGALQDIEEIGKVVAGTNAVFVVDTCQTAGVVPIDMDKCNIDVLVFTGHKGLFGPMGMGGMIVREGVNIRPTKTGGTGVDSIAEFQPEEYPFRLEAGTVSIPGIAGLNAAQRWFAELGSQLIGDNANAPVSHQDATGAALTHIHRQEIAVTHQLIEAFAALPGVTIYGPRGNRPRVATFTINIGGLPAEQASAMMDADHGVCVRAGLHCAPLVHQDYGTLKRNGSIRFAPGFFTDKEDTELALEAVTELAQYEAAR